VHAPNWGHNANPVPDLPLNNGVHVNLGLHGAGLSVGPRGLHLGVNRRGMYTSAGIPGAGIYAARHVRGSSGEHPTVAGSACR
jgi:hypothetical protein